MKVWHAWKQKDTNNIDFYEKCNFVYCIESTAVQLKFIC